MVLELYRKLSTGCTKFKFLISFLYNKKMKTNTNHLFAWLIIILIIGLYVLILVKGKKCGENYILKGPYESCEDQICPDFKTKATCMCDKQQQIKNCCIASCPNQECKDACVPLFPC